MYYVFENLGDNYIFSPFIHGFIEWKPEALIHSGKASLFLFCLNISTPDKVSHDWQASTYTGVSNIKSFPML